MVRDQASPPDLVADGSAPRPGRAAWTEAGVTAWHYDSELPTRAGVGYRFGSTRYEVSTAFAPTTRIADVSCNGRKGDAEP
jgi:hypothetical protein